MEGIKISASRKLTNEEMNLIKIMWGANGRLTPTELILEVEKQYNKKWAKQTINTILKRMMSKGVVKVQKEGRNSYYTAVSKEEYETMNAKDLLDSMYNGSIKNFLVALYNDKNTISKDDLQEIKDWFLDE